MVFVFVLEKVQFRKVQFLGTGWKRCNFLPVAFTTIMSQHGAVFSNTTSFCLSFLSYSQKKLNLDKNVTTLATFGSEHSITPFKTQDVTSVYAPDLAGNFPTIIEASNLVCCQYLSGGFPVSQKLKWSFRKLFFEKVCHNAQYFWSLEKSWTLQI